MKSKRVKRAEKFSEYRLKKKRLTVMQGRHDKPVEKKNKLGLFVWLTFALVTTTSLLILEIAGVM